MTDNSEINAIMESSRKNNPLLELTGMLVYGGGLFLQVLEGPQESVLRQYLKILNDPRHFNCQIIYISSVSSRMFDQWSMGVIQASQLQMEEIARLCSHHQAEIEAKAFANLMRDFVKRLNSQPVMSK